MKFGPFNPALVYNSFIKLDFKESGDLRMESPLQREQRYNFVLIGLTGLLLVSLNLTRNPLTHLINTLGNLLAVPFHLQLLNRLLALLGHPVAAWLYLILLAGLLVALDHRDQAFTSLGIALVGIPIFAVIRYFYHVLGTTFKLTVQLDYRHFCFALTLLLIYTSLRPYYKEVRLRQLNSLLFSLIAICDCLIALQLTKTNLTTLALDYSLSYIWLLCGWVATPVILKWRDRLHYPLK